MNTEDLERQYNYGRNLVICTSLKSGSSICQHHGGQTIITIKILQTRATYNINYNSNIYYKAFKLFFL